MSSPLESLIEPAVSSAPAKSSSRPHRITIRLNDDTLTALDQELALEGREDRAEFVERLLREHVERRKREQAYLKRAKRVVTTESGQQVLVHPQGPRLQLGTVEQSLAAAVWRKEAQIASRTLSSRRFFLAENETKGLLCKVSALETEDTHSKVRHLVIQHFGKSEETWAPLDYLSLHRPSLSWLIDSLQQAEAAFQAESSRNRKKAHQARASRTTQEVLLETELRQTYIERYSKEKVNKAVALAGKHRTRALRRNLTEHFTAWEWLDRCDRSNFRCMSCGAQVNLEPHHRIELAAGGPNTIDNIDPLCSYCHRQVPLQLEPEQVADLWDFQQQRLLDSFQVGNEVCPQGQGRPGVILELFPFRRGVNIPSNSCSKEVIWRGENAHDWVVAKARVSWVWGKSTREKIVDLRDLEKVDEIANP